MRRRRPRTGWAAVLLGSLALVGCTSTEAPEPEPATTTETPSPTPTPTPEPVRWPLTGLGTDAPAQTPALAVKVENTAMARPQAGLEDADIVWEEMVEGGITRFNAVFHSRLPETVGPIRSVRPMDVAIVAPLGGPQVISGGQQLFLDELTAAGVQLISNDAGDAGFVRSPDRRAPHNLYGTPQVFLEQAESSEPPAEQFEFAVDPDEATAVTAGEPAAALRVDFPAASPGWAWDDDAGWLRDEAGTPSLSAAGEQLWATNVVVLRVEIVASAGRDQSGDPVPETVLTGDGEALVATGGQVVEAGWRKEAPADPVTLTTEDGSPVLLAAGTTWVELVPVDRGGVTVEP
ncbi:DUF3048 domain-containing protein [Georgenia sp. MJ173]|uniref:DUF3048 domain-containing protein n=1 Tax=Georgenia sunbinii TaxID=3117728 RepID=UPI002F266692